jgi:fructose/tagatose bisphosphate aldolase
VIAADRRALLRARLGTKRPTLATNINDQQDIGAAVEAAQRAGSPIILLASVRTIEHAGMSTIAQLVRAAREQSSVPVWLQLDHASHLSLIERCMEARVRHRDGGLFGRAARGQRAEGARGR